MRLRFALLNAAHDPTDSRRNFRRELDADLVEYHTPDGDIPETFAFDAVVVTGSRSSVYRDEPWIEDLERWVGEAIERGMPALGVCFGHQLLASVLGGEVEAMNEYELGYRTVERRGDSTLLSGVDGEFTVFTTHSDRVARLPPGATLLAANDRGIQGFRRGDAFGVQFHPEYDAETARRVTRGKDEDEDEVGEERLARVLDGIDADTYAAACEAKTLFDNFTAYVRQHSGDRRDERAGRPADG